MDHKTHRRTGPQSEEPKTLDDTPTARARTSRYISPSHVGPEEPDTLEAQVERHKIEILKLWGFGADLRDRVTLLEDARAGVSDRPSETSLSLRPTRARIVLKNWRPTKTLVVLVLGLFGLLLLGALALAALIRH